MTGLSHSNDSVELGIDEDEEEEEEDDEDEEEDKPLRGFNWLPNELELKLAMLELLETPVGDEELFNWFRINEFELNPAGFASVLMKSNLGEDDDEDDDEEEFLFEGEAVNEEDDDEIIDEDNWFEL